MIIRIPRINLKTDLSFVEYVFLFGIFLKQFYLRQSGTVQISDAIIVLSVFTLLSSGRMRINQIDVSLVIFVACTFLVNGVYAFFYGYRMMMASIYMLYNLSVVLGFRIFTKKRSFIKSMMFTMKANLLTQFIIYLVGLGRMYGNTRYQGTFNDPNQFGFFVICCIFLLYLCSFYLDKKMSLVWYCLTGYLVLISASRGMALAFLIFLFFAVIQPSKALKSPLLRFLVLLAFLLGGIFILMGGMNFLLSIFSINSSKTNYLMRRFRQRGGGGSLVQRIYAIIVDRKMTRIFIKPLYFLFGCGEGVWYRFLEFCSDDGEIHSTFIGLCYYYGIIPYCMFAKWIWDCIKKTPRKTKGVFYALLFEALTLINHRQPLFWMIFAFGALLKNGAESELREKQYNPAHTEQIEMTKYSV